MAEIVRVLIRAQGFFYVTAQGDTLLLPPLLVHCPGMDIPKSIISQEVTPDSFFLKSILLPLPQSLQAYRRLSL